MENLYSFINPSSNDSISSFSGRDLQILLVMLDDFNLDLRSIINIPNNVTFGLELEFEKANKENIRKYLSEKRYGENWIFKNDFSLDRGYEIASPILIDTEKNWNDLKDICSILEKNSKILYKAGGHIHIGAHTLGSDKETWTNFAKLWSVYENVIYRFLYGEYYSYRNSLPEYAGNFSEELLEHYDKLDNNRSTASLLKSIFYKRYNGVNFQNIKLNELDTFTFNNTIEFRAPNASLDPVIWQNNVNLLTKILLYCKSKEYDIDTIDKRHSINKNKYTSLELYDEVYIDEAIEFADLIFDNNLDKMYFLRQYLKGYEINKETGYKKCKKFTK